MSGFPWKRRSEYPGFRPTDGSRDSRVTILELVNFTLGGQSSGTCIDE